MQLDRIKWLLAGIVSIVAGYVLLASSGSMTVAPTLLVVGYCVLIPLHLWSRYRAGVGE